MPRNSSTDLVAYLDFSTLRKVKCSDFSYLCCTKIEDIPLHMRDRIATLTTALKGLGLMIASPFTNRILAVLGHKILTDLFDAGFAKKVSDREIVVAAGYGTMLFVAALLYLDSRRKNHLRKIGGISFSNHMIVNQALMPFSTPVGALMCGFIVDNPKNTGTFFLSPTIGAATLYLLILAGALALMLLAAMGCGINMCCENHYNRRAKNREETNRRDYPQIEEPNTDAIIFSERHPQQKQDNKKKPDVRLRELHLNLA